MKSFLLLILLSSFVSCASLPDEYLCTNLSESKCYCDRTISSDPKIIDDDNTLDGQTCADLRSNSILMPAKTWASIKSYILKVCKQYNNCAGVGDWENKVDVFQKP